ncbi:hypothetical protein IJI69_00390 [Candidatus Saccharibacteria bacterium]|nr:hypothetical protein [Candidatus Saccharibacteria bacterium]MBQ6127147.1 hypothetical protein [Candidatus Saccharibacteria bacterium]
MSRPTKAAAIYSFWNSFGIPAYEENTVPDDAELPYITYQLVTDSFDMEVPMAASIWYRSPLWTEINAKTEEISEELYNGVLLECDKGLIWLKKGSPFAQNMSDSSDDMIRRKYLNLAVEYLTAY